MIFEVEEQEDPAIVYSETPPRYPRRQIQRKNYKELEMPDEDHFLCKFHQQFCHKPGQSMLVYKRNKGLENTVLYL